MEKSLFSRRYSLFLHHLRAAREKEGLTQEALAKRLGETQSFISKCERGERRIDIVEIRAFCKGIGISFIEFVRRLDREMD